MNNEFAVLTPIVTLAITAKAFQALVQSEVYYKVAPNRFLEVLPIGRFLVLAVVCMTFTIASSKHFIDMESLPSSSDLTWSITTTICGLILYLAVYKIRELNQRIKQFEWRAMRENFEYSRTLQLLDARNTRMWMIILVLAMLIGIWGGLSALFQTKLFMP